MFTVFIKFCVHICVQHILPSILIPVKQLRTVRGVVFRCVDAAVAVVALVRCATLCLCVLTSIIDVSYRWFWVQKEGQAMKKMIIVASFSFSLLATSAFSDDAQSCDRYFSLNQYELAHQSCVTAAEQGNATAQHYLGVMYGEGLGVEQNNPEAVRWLLAAAEQSVAGAQHHLGWMYHQGLGVEQSYAEAVRWYRAAAEQGIIWAQTNLGLMYRQGLGVAQNYMEAMRWYRAAAEQGTAVAQNNLGVMYEQGWGVLQNFKQAHMWYNIAAANGYGTAAENRNRIAARMTTQQISDAQARAQRCLDSNYSDC